MTYADAAAAIAAATTITVTTHLNPDGDGIGSCLALMHALRAAGKTVRFRCPSRVAGLYRFLPGFDECEPVIAEDAVRRARRVDLLISCDCGDLARLGVMAKTPCTAFVNLDHHASNTRFAGINVVDESAESTGVVVDALLTRLKLPLTPAIAACLYTTIVFDTGRFMHSNTTPRALRFAAKLLETGIDASAINRALTYTRTRHDLDVQRLGLEKLEVDEAEPKLAGIALSAADIKAVGEPEDWGELVELPRSLAGNAVAWLARESADRKTVKLSLRANPPFAVLPTAQVFGGGGHVLAAGATAPGDLATVLKKLRPLLRQAVADGAKAPAPTVTPAVAGRARPAARPRAR